MAVSASVRIERQTTDRGRSLTRVRTPGGIQHVLSDQPLTDTEVMAELAEDRLMTLTAARTVVIHRRVGLGDVVFALAVAQAIRDTNPTAAIHFVTDRRFTGLLRWFACLTTVGAPGEALPSLARPVLELDLQAILPADGQDRVQVMATAAGVAVQRFATPPPHLPAAVEQAARERLAAGGVAAGARLLAVAPFSSGRPRSRSLTVAEVNRILARLHQDDPARGLVVLCSEAVAGLEVPPGGADLTGRLSVEEAAGCLWLSDGLVGVDSGLLYLAATFGRPVVGLFSHIDPAWRLGTADSYTALKPVGLPCWPCGDFDGQPLCTATAHDCACMRAVAAPELVAHAVRHPAPATAKVELLVPARTAPGPNGAARQRLLCVPPWLIAGGGERHLLLLCQGLSEVADVELVVSRAEADGHFAPAFRRWPVRHLSGDEHDRAVALAAAIDHGRPSAVLFYNNPITLEALALARHRPRRVVAIVHTQFPHEVELVRHPLNHHVDAFACVSEAVRQQLSRHAGPDPRYAVVPNGVSLAEFADGGSVRTELGCDERHFVIGGVGRIAEGKNPALTIRALSLLPEHVTGLLVGWGEEVEPCQQLMWTLGLGHRCHILGPRTDVAPVVRALDAFVLPTDIEGAIPYAMLEAMAARVPCLVAPVSDIPLRLRDGQDVLYIERTAESIAAAVQRLLDTPELGAQLAANAYALLARELTVETMVAGYRRLLALEG